MLLRPAHLESALVTAGVLPADPEKPDGEDELAGDEATAAKVQAGEVLGGGLVVEGLRANAETSTEGDEDHGLGSGFFGAASDILTGGGPDQERGRRVEACNPKTNLNYPKQLS